MVVLIVGQATPCRNPPFFDPGVASLSLLILALSISNLLSRPISAKFRVDGDCCPWTSLHARAQAHERAATIMQAKFRGDQARKFVRRKEIEARGEIYDVQRSAKTADRDM